MFRIIRPRASSIAAMSRTPVCREAGSRKMLVVTTRFAPSAVTTAVKTGPNLPVSATS
jgi:hypothetical protein